MLSKSKQSMVYVRKIKHDFLEFAFFLNPGNQHNVLCGDLAFLSINIISRNIVKYTIRYCLLCFDALVVCYFYSTESMLHGWPLDTCAPCDPNNDRQGSLEGWERGLDRLLGLVRYYRPGKHQVAELGYHVFLCVIATPTSNGLYWTNQRYKWFRWSSNMLSRIRFCEIPITGPRINYLIQSLVTKGETDNFRPHTLEPEPNFMSVYEHQNTISRKSLSHLSTFGIYNVGSILILLVAIILSSPALAFI